jgi:Fe2+ or Zn2+ uptake regulation protein
MTLSEEATERLADIVANQPTKNGELQELWDMDSGSEVHQYLEAELKEYYYRNENSLICATPEATTRIDGADSDRVQTMTVSPLQWRIVEVLAGPEEEPQSVVATLQAVRAAGEDPTVDDVRSALRSLADMGIVEIVQKTVPTFRLAVTQANLDVEVRDE